MSALAQEGFDDGAYLPTANERGQEKPPNRPAVFRERDRRTYKWPLGPLSQEPASCASLVNAPATRLLALIGPNCCHACIGRAFVVRTVALLSIHIYPTRCYTKGYTRLSDTRNFLTITAAYVETISFLSSAPMDCWWYTLVVSLNAQVM